MSEYDDSRSINKVIHNVKILLKGKYWKYWLKGVPKNIQGAQDFLPPSQMCVSVPDITSGSDVVFINPIHVASS